jgi:hypothetical protein
MINIDNYFTAIQNINWDSMPEALVKGHNLVEGAAVNNWAAYRNNDNIRRVVDAYMEKLQGYLDRQSPVPSPQQKPAVNKEKVSRPTKVTTPKATTPKPAKATKTVKPARASKSKEGTPVESIDIDVQFIRRYAAMHGKVRTEAQILTLIHSLQKAILDRKIRKESPYAKEIAQIQEQLIKLYEQMDGTVLINIAATNLKRYQQIADSQDAMLSIRLLKAYVSLNGKKDIYDKVARLLQRMKKTVDTGTNTPINSMPPSPRYTTTWIKNKPGSASTPLSSTASGVL